MEFFKEEEGPNTDKSSKGREAVRLRCGLSSVMGCAPVMNVAHTAMLNLRKETSFFGVFDGFGNVLYNTGHENGIPSVRRPRTTGKSVARFCARFFHDFFVKLAAGNDDLIDAMRQSFSRTDERIKGRKGWIYLNYLDGVMQVPKKPPGWKGPRLVGSTACVAVLRNNQLIVGNVGDSRCVLSRNRQAIDVSTVHKPGLALERERILNAGGTLFEEKIDGCIRFSRGIGFMKFKENEALSAEEQIITCVPDINEIDITEEDEFFILATSRVWDSMTSQQLVDFVHENIDNEIYLSDVCKKVLDLCPSPLPLIDWGWLSYGGANDKSIVMILVQFKKPDQSHSARV
ncbi:hypothetical protein LUZ61_014310 [Rhynchospora tenuis]|uniref:protein-serine/threonine phosphatase n=1 Tax=Rhynchospora tenuis TaxID=198213 RepID=A0AAD5Z368_9POAL|nr:hypothetical protein LUZ61_014310 [Rhynchospora tenuis]